MLTDVGEMALPFGRPRQEETPVTFEALVREHQPLVLRTAYRLVGTQADAQDASQEVFLRLYRNLSRIEGDPKAWLYRVTVNVCHDHYRRMTPSIELPGSLSDPAPNPERIATLEQRKHHLHQAIQRLPEREREALVLRDIEGLSTGEVAQILGVEEVTVRSQISTARVKLAKYMKGIR